MLKHVETLNGEILKPETPCWENKKEWGVPGNSGYCTLVERQECTSVSGRLWRYWPRGEQVELAFQWI